MNTDKISKSLEYIQTVSFDTLNVIFNTDLNKYTDENQDGLQNELAEIEYKWLNMDENEKQGFMHKYPIENN